MVVVVMVVVRMVLEIIIGSIGNLPLFGPKPMARLNDKTEHCLSTQNSPSWRKEVERWIEKVEERWIEKIELSHTQSRPRKDKNVPWKLKMAQWVGETALLSNLTKLLESQSLLHWNKALEKQRLQVQLHQYLSLAQAQVQQRQETDKPVLRNCLGDLKFICPGQMNWLV